MHVGLRCSLFVLLVEVRGGPHRLTLVHDCSRWSVLVPRWSALVHSGPPRSTAACFTSMLVRPDLCWFKLVHPVSPNYLAAEETSPPAVYGVRQSFHRVARSDGCGRQNASAMSDASPIARKVGKLNQKFTITPLRYLPLVRSCLPAAYPPDPPLAECRPSSLPLAAFSFSYRPVKRW